MELSVPWTRLLLWELMSRFHDLRFAGRIANDVLNNIAQSAGKQRS